MVTKSRYFKSAGVLAAASVTASAALFAQGAAAQQVLNPAAVPQFRNTLPNPLAPSFIWKPDSPGGVVYTLKIQEFFQDLGLDGLLNLPTRVWGYGKTGQAPSFPGRTFEVQRGTPITVSYVNALTSSTGAPLPNRMPVDTTLDWANPGAVGGITPVPVVAHLHGGDSAFLSDGLPDAWGTSCAETPTPRACRNAAPVQQGRLYGKPYRYDNSQEAGTLWYHDHALGITRTNVYMGLAGFYILRDANENALRTGGGPADRGAAPVLPSGPYEIPIVIQDREFTTLKQLFYPSGGAGLPVNSHQPEFFGRVILVNGQAWPKMDVEPRKYRLRLLNGSDSRFYDLRAEVFAANAPIVPGAGRRVPMLVVGNELGLLDSPATPSLDTPVDPGTGPVRSNEPNVLPIGPGERYDVVVDFSGLPKGSRVVVTNSANSPYPNADGPDAGLNDRLMAFDVKVPLSATPKATVALGTDLRRDAVANPDLGPVVVPPGTPVRRIMLFEGTDALGRLQTMIGPVDKDPVSGQQGTLTFKDPITEQPAVGDTEVWEFYNTTVDAHPIHMHLVDFRVINREGFSAALADKPNNDGSLGAIVTNDDGTKADVPNGIVLDGNVVAPSAHEAGKKDTAKMFPGEVTRVLVTFNRAGEYVYHCHILSHEDHEMMRPYKVQ